MRGLRFARLVGAAVLAVSVVPVAAGATHGGPDEPVPFAWAQGAGQVVINSSDPTAAGDTISFTAREVPDGPRVVLQGAVDYAPTGIRGGEAFRWRGRLSCMVVHEDTATIGGSIDRPGSPVQRFSLRVVDRPTRDDLEADTLELAFGDGTVGDCSDGDFQDVRKFAIARGNVTVHDPA